MNGGLPQFSSTSRSSSTCPGASLRVSFAAFRERGQTRAALGSQLAQRITWGCAPGTRGREGRRGSR
eukprot:3935971-Rhodomonas_salina.1